MIKQKALASANLPPHKINQLALLVTFPQTQPRKGNRSFVGRGEKRNPGAESSKMGLAFKPCASSFKGQPRNAEVSLLGNTFF